MATSRIDESQPSSKSLAERLPSPQSILIGVGIILAVVVDLLAYHYGGLNFAVQVVLGLLLGLALFNARFGFTSAFRRFLAVGNGEGIRAHMVMLAVSSTFFAIVLANKASLFGGIPAGYVSPVGTSVVVGSFLFGLGMQLGEGCASGTLYHIGAGRTENYFTIIGFVVGSVLGAWNFNFWVNDTPHFQAISLATSTGLGYTGAWIVQIVLFALIYWITLVVEKKRKPPKMHIPPTATGWKRIFRGSWPIMVAAVALGLLNGLTLLVRNQPWGITSAFALWGSKIALAVGIPVDHWSYWAGDKGAALHQSIFADSTTVMNFGVILGSFIAATSGGLFFLRKLPFKMIIASLLGGLLMGYGARISFGCNIGAYFSGISSFSVHAWVWLVFGFVGSYVALYIRPLFGMKNPKSNDHFC
ncbi:YeeE/YedE family protein [Pullulanibacillus sp. KACC 23026]|uniref:YeeE/YedE family protein n=1 Tax=Pullulanibacillus sp. KACC 23026 TaxID=3028315 RepID=UPI0023B09126|nr:YeeE/YedE family protein [Pullulanibacillus sp. KACC 23026]WEG12920.1 YeeE/YedE family protein [Pullulanibacillus sp. KACC 23026]